MTSLSSWWSRLPSIAKVTLVLATAGFCTMAGIYRAETAVFGLLGLSRPHQTLLDLAQDAAQTAAFYCYTVFAKAASLARGARDTLEDFLSLE